MIKCHKKSHYATIELKDPHPFPQDATVARTRLGALRVKMRRVVEDLGLRWTCPPGAPPSDTTRGTTPATPRRTTHSSQGALMHFIYVIIIYCIGIAVITSKLRISLFSSI